MDLREQDPEDPVGEIPEGMADYPLDNPAHQATSVFHEGPAFIVVFGLHGSLILDHPPETCLQGLNNCVFEVFRK